MQHQEEEEVAAYMAQRKARKMNKPTKFRTYVAASFNSPAGMQDFDFSVSNNTTNSNHTGAAAVVGAMNPSSAAANEPSILAPNTLVQGEWIDEDFAALQQNHPRINLGIQVSELESLTEQEDRRSLDIKVQQEDAKKAFHSSRNNVLEQGTGPAVASAWGKVDKDVVRLAKEEDQKRREANRPVHLGQDFIASASHVGSKPGYDFTMGSQGLGYYWNPQPEEKAPTFAVVQDEPKRNAWAARSESSSYLRGGPRLGDAPAPAAAAAAPVSTGYLRGPRLGETAAQEQPVAAAPKPGVWRPSSVNRDSAGPPPSSSGGPPRASPFGAARPAFASAPPQVGDDGRDSMGLKRSSNAWKPRGRD